MRFFAVVSLLFIMQHVVHAQNNLQANLYYQLIKNEQKNIAREIYEFKKSASALNLKILKFQINKSIDVVEKAAVYNNETAFRDAAIEQFRFFLSVADEEYDAMLKLVEDPDLEYKDFFEKKDALGKKISIRSKPYDEKFNTAEDAYLAKYGIKPE
jgi:hypothetical protein